MLRQLRNRHFLIIDVILLAVTPGLALFLRIEPQQWRADYLAPLLFFAAFSVALVKLPILYALGIYKRYWRYASVDDLCLILYAAGIATALNMFGFLGTRALGLIPGISLPRSIPLIDGLLMLLVVGGTRFSVRALDKTRLARQRGGMTGFRRVLIVGAGDAGSQVVREMRSNPLVNLQPVGFADDSVLKQGTSIHDVPVLGPLQDIPRIVRQHDIQEVIVAMPAAPGKLIRRIKAVCDELKIPHETIPGLSEILTGRVGITQFRQIELEDLLRREPAKIDSHEISQLLANRRVLVTGAGGSIGSELCRQIALTHPAELILLGHGENSIFDLDRELVRNYPGIRIHRLIADVRDKLRLASVFCLNRPEIVFHAAAHKHVPLMEENVVEAVTNNVLGTRNMIEVSTAEGVETFVMISTDKAVNPTSVMGATKRAAELIVCRAASTYAGRCVCVRFGNVLGSRGSVVNVFREQIAQGGPVTVTHPEMRRYFMTIPEAVQLVLQAMALGTTGEVLALDMGAPLKVVDLARDLIMLSGMQEGRDIDIVFTGMRPGEKLFEELFFESDHFSRTRHEQIFVAGNGHGSALIIQNRFESAIDTLIEAARSGDAQATRDWLKRIVPDYQLMEETLTPSGAATWERGF